MFIAMLFTIAKIWKQPKCPSTFKEWIKKMLYIHTMAMKKDEECHFQQHGWTQRLSY